MKAILDTRPASPYDDGLGRYHFPSRYLKDALATVGDWIVEREPQREGGRRAYVAVARVDRIVADGKRAGHHYAMLSDFLPFDQPVPFRGPDGLREAMLRDVADSRLVGRTLQGRSIRTLGDDDFAAIVRASVRPSTPPTHGG